jgi:adenylylsulfate kinase
MPTIDGETTVGPLLTGAQIQKYLDSYVHAPIDTVVVTPLGGADAADVKGYGVPVVFDATANRRAYRVDARMLAKFVEAHVQCPIHVCTARDPKGLYRRAAAGAVATVPGLQTTHEPPLNADLVVLSDRETPDGAAQRIVALLEDRGCIRCEREARWQ